MASSYQDRSEAAAKASRTIKLIVNASPTGDEQNKAVLINNGDHGQLDDLKNRIADGHREIMTLVMSTAGRGILLGDLLLEAKCMLPHGQFLTWIDAELTPMCGIQRRTAQRYMHLAKNQHHLVERLRKFVSVPGDISMQDLQELMQSLRIGEAVKLLALDPAEPKKTISEADVPNQQQDEAGLQKLDRLVEAFRTRMHCESEPNPTSLFVASSDPDLNFKMIASTVARCGSGGSQHVLIAAANAGADRWLPLVDSFPRVYIRRNESNAAVATLGLKFLIGLIPEEHFDSFHEVFSHLGACFFPRESNHSPLSHSDESGDSNAKG